MSKVFLDTNVLAYLFDDRSPEKQKRAGEVVQSGREFVVSTQVMLELFVVLTRKFQPPLPAADAQDVLRSVSRWEVVPADAQMVMSAVRTAAAHQLSMWDAMVLEAAVVGGCSELWSEDLADGSQLRGVSMVNPFRGLAP